MAKSVFIFKKVMYKNLGITAQFNRKYDKSPSPGKKESDYTYLLTFGYVSAN